MIIDNTLHLSDGSRIYIKNLDLELFRRTHKRNYSIRVIRMIKINKILSVIE